MDYPQLVRDYGYAAIIVGTFIEGEAVLVLGGMAASEGWLDLRLVILCGALGVLISDQTCFCLGRWAARPILARFPRLRARVELALAQVERHQSWLAIAFQFIPGTATVTPVAFGMSRIGAWRFLGLDLAGIMLWSLACALLGMASGTVASRLWHDFADHQWAIAIVAIVLGLVVCLWRWFR